MVQISPLFATLVRLFIQARPASLSSLNQALRGRGFLMTFFELLTIGEIVLYWRFFVGIVATAAIGMLVFSLFSAVVPSWLAWVIFSAIGVAGVIFSFLWQLRADSA